MVPVIKLSAVQVLAIACLGVAVGLWLKRRIPVLDRFNIPAPIVGGLVYAAISLALRDRVLNFEFDTVLQNILMIAFFTTIGLGASLRTVRDGGIGVAVFWGVATAGAILQNALGIGMAKAMGLNPLLGIVSGSVALTGGPATALAFGKSFEEMGVAGATTLGVASAMAGITAGGLLGGHIGASLIHRFGLRPTRQSAVAVASSDAAVVYSRREAKEVEVMEPAGSGDDEGSSLMRTVIVVAIAMGLGSILSPFLDTALRRFSLFLPVYIGAMLAAFVLRNLDDRFRFARISQERIDEVGSVALNLFIVMAMLTLRWWELFNLALPLLVLLAAQIVLVYLMCVFLAFRAMGRTYDSAIMAGGFCGFMLGTTANAMACMSVLTEKYGPSPRAFIVVPLVGASLADFTNALVISNMAGWFR